MSHTHGPRRPLHFDHLHEALADAQKLYQQGYEKHGNWTLGQVCDHLAGLIDRSIDGFEFDVPVLLRWLPRLAKRYFLAKGLPGGIKLRGRPAVVLPGEVSDEQGLEHFRQAIERLAATEQRQPSPVLGPLSRAEWDTFHCRHAELHLSHLIPHAEGAAS